jgi:hypothetical protein
LSTLSHSTVRANAAVFLVPTVEERLKGMHGNILLTAAGQVALSLDDLATRIRNAHASVVSAFNSAIDNAITAGRLLIEAKNTPHGQHGRWGKFLKRCDVGERQAQRYMKLAKLVEANPTLKSDLADYSIEQAIKRLSAPKPKGVTAPKPPVTTKKTAKVKPAPGKRITHIDIIELLLAAPPAEIAKAFDSLGFDATWAAIPAAWWPLLADRLAERQAVTPEVTVDPALIPSSDLAIPSFLDRRAPALPVAAEEKPSVAVTPVVVEEAPPGVAAMADPIAPPASRKPDQWQKGARTRRKNKVALQRAAKVWRKLGADDLENLIHAEQRYGVDHADEPHDHRQLRLKQIDQMRKRLPALRARSEVGVMTATTTPAEQQLDLFVDAPLPPTALDPCGRIGGGAMKIFSDYADAQLRDLADTARHRELLDALTPHAYDGTEAHHAIDQTLPGIENSAAAATIQSAVAKQYGNTVPIDAAIEVMLKLLEDGALS